MLSVARRPQPLISPPSRGIEATQSPAGWTSGPSSRDGARAPPGGRNGLAALLKRTPRRSSAPTSDRSRPLAPLRRADLPLQAVLHTPPPLPPRFAIYLPKDDLLYDLRELCRGHAEFRLMSSEVAAKLPLRPASISAHCAPATQLRKPQRCPRPCSISDSVVFFAAIGTKCK